MIEPQPTMRATDYRCISAFPKRAYVYLPASPLQSGSSGFHPLRISESETEAPLPYRLREGDGKIECQLAIGINSQ